jgi:hypothetical protein
MANTNRTRKIVARTLASMTNRQLAELAERKPALAKACSVASAGYSSLCYAAHITSVAQALDR